MYDICWMIGDRWEMRDGRAWVGLNPMQQAWHSGQKTRLIAPSVIAIPGGNIGSRCQSSCGRYLVSLAKPPNDRPSPRTGCGPRLIAIDWLDPNWVWDPNKDMKQRSCTLNSAWDFNETSEGEAEKITKIWTLTSSELSTLYPWHALMA